MLQHDAPEYPHELIDTSSSIRGLNADPVAGSPVLLSIPERQWDRLSGQRDILINAMTRIFTWLNGGVFLFTLVAWIAGLVDPTYRIVDRATIITLIGATVVQSGIAFIAITRFLFPRGAGDR